MKMIIGSKNPAKIQAVKAIFGDTWDLEGASVDSGVRAQPMCDEETRQGAIQRAKTCSSLPGAAAGIGLEGGVTLMDDGLYICNWGALSIGDNVWSASGAKLLLPEFIAQPVLAGEELGPVMRAFTSKEDISTTEGAVGVFTNGHMSRGAMFEHVCLLLKGQYSFYQYNQKKEAEG
jgi:inosine/xanthosine triphosphatase